MKVKESIYDKQIKTLRKGEWFSPTGFEHEVSVCGNFVTTADVLTLYAPLYPEQVECEDEMLTYPCNYFERKEFRTVHGDGSIILCHTALKWNGATPHMAVSPMQYARPHQRTERSLL